ncbi:MAG: hypothetical protein HKN47_13050 [Pirellulaceae bacterium]|nr:hypothetical protein [Pirellulaceae bacterium]
MLSPIAWGQDSFTRVSGKHIKLTTDIDDPHRINDLVQSFDAAVPQWAAFWQMPAGALDHFVVDACVIRDRDAFVRAGLIPNRVPRFPFGYALQNRVWVMAQESDYYTRHLLLHEGVHSLAFAEFGGTGPSWFMEGTAEMLAVHSGRGAATVINRVPVSRESVPYWGRFKLIDATRAEGTIPSLETVFGYPRDLKSDVESYGWSWAATMLLYQYPDYRDAFLTAADNGKRNDMMFNDLLRRDLKSQWPVVVARWRLMCHDLDYGFDWDRERVNLSMDDQVWDGKPLSLQIAADQGWQSIGVRLSRGMKLKVMPSGTCTLATDLKPWVSEPAGVTVRYHDQKPLGQLLACLVPNVPDNAATLSPLQVAAITKPAVIPIRQHCWLLFRVNDAPGELADNSGAYQLKISSNR